METIIFKRKFYILCVSLFCFVNIPTLIMQLTVFYRWGTWFEHHPVGLSELIFSKLFIFADFLSHLLIFPPIPSLILSIIIITKIAIDFKTFRFTANLILSFVLPLILLAITFFSLGTMLFYGWFWV